MYILIYFQLIVNNQKALVNAYEYQNYGRIEDSINSLENIVGNFNYLGLMIDQIPLSQKIIQENREILSQAHLNQLSSDKFPKFDYKDKFSMKIIKKNKQKKVKWTEKEQQLFLEGINKFGNNGILFIIFIFQILKKYQNIQVQELLDKCVLICKNIY